MSSSNKNTGRPASKVLSLLAGFLVAGYVSSPVYAFTPFQAPLLSTAAVTPNVMLLLDNSGSMNTVIFHSGYNPKIDYPTAMYCKSGTSCDVTNVDHWTDTASISGHSRVAQGGCSAGYYKLGAKNKFTVRKNTVYYPGSAAQTVCIPFPTVVQTNSTGSTADEADLPKNYLEYLVQGLLAGTITASDIPTGHRMGVAKTVAKQIISDNISGVRFGLASFRPGNTASGSTGETYEQQGGIVVSGLGAVKTTLDSNVNSLYGTTYTPLSEAYYDVVRYYRGLASSYNTAPTTLTDQVQYRCQKNFGIVVTDGAPTYDSKFFNTSTDPDRDNSSVAGTNNLPDWDGLSPSPPTAYSDGDTSLGLGSEGSTYYLDDIAKFAYDIDIRPTASTLDLAGKSFETVAFNQQNIKTYTVGFAQDNQMLKDAAQYGHGKYYTASDSAGLTSALSQALNEISAQAGSGGAGASSSSSLTTSTRYYKTLYDPADWRGTIEAYALSATTGRLVSRVWTTDNTITPSSNGASYQTYNTATNNVVALSYTNVSPAQQTVLSTSLPTGVTGTQLVEWSKGTAVTGLRSRTVLLGDVINSTLERLSSTERLASSITGDTSYDSYVSAKASMTDSLLVNSNDGFFHVINAGTGGHRYAYMPSSVFSSLHTVAATDYATSGGHKFMVDGGITVADAQLGSNWATVAVSGMGGGGKSMFAVKLFSAGNNAISGLWEITAPATSTPTNSWNDLGYTYSKPLVARNASNEWVAIFGNGYGSHLGKASLYVVNLSTGALIQEIVVDANASGTAPNGLSAPQMVVNAQYQVQKVYAGDLRGNLWEFDLSGATGSVANSGTPLFEAGVDHPITARPLVVEHPNGGHLVLFGTGKLMEAADKLSTTLQTFYGIWDKNATSGTVASSSLVAQSFTSSSVITANGESQTYYNTSENSVDWDTKRGWYLPLSLNNVLQGERVIYPAQTTMGRVIFVTAKVDANDPCESTGSGKLVELDAISGKMLSYPVLDTNGDGVVDTNDTRVSGLGIDDGLPGQPVIIDAGDQKDTQGKYILKSTGAVTVVDECGEVNNGQCGAITQSRRIMWRQLQ
ncbi:hypothetical protein A9179_18370 [Pseudomonas alcaligenes]|uniref:PilY1 beta-propeller domain-containing protein n=1 Tax=Aquipseudomonas alcaligenes TaxID=43263 RepID=A0ABR7S5M1_AQUAC|nr:PilC/PilY family type IV pilus protein [Pseudomonas alcaligenes]MBC9252239.1 hypothetical protein [Pseudomonas alcaligenes]